MPQPDITKLTDEIERMIDAYSKELEPIQKTMFNRSMAILKGVTTDADGNIKATVNNYKTITQVKSELNKQLSSDLYLDKVAQISTDFNTITAIQSSYFASMFTDFAAPALLKELQKQAINTTIETLTESGIQEILVKKATNILSENIKSGSNFTEMTKELETFIKGNDKVPGKLESYSKQIVTDAMSQYAGNYNKLVTDDLGLKWHVFTGGLMKDSRPMCIELHAKRYIHQSEFKGICEGKVNGKFVTNKDGETHDKNGRPIGLQGFISGTDEFNYTILRDGYQCQHQVIPVSDEAVPKELRDGIK